MDKALRSKIQAKLKETADNPRVKLPGKFLFSEENDTLIMTFCTKQGFGLGQDVYNMQDDSAAFEGWAVVLYVHYLNGKGKIRLDIRSEDVPEVSEELYTKYQHYSRFLYRALRFSQQYSWFQLSARLTPLTDSFDNYLKENTFTNNVPSGPARENGKLENHNEARFAEQDSLLLEKLNTGEIYRQLPVGLFQEVGTEKKPVFTGNRSAIDLWAVTGDTLTVLELKAKHKMVGAVTELFFYANYTYDLFVEKDNTFHKKITNRGGRGYTTLVSAPLEAVRGCLLLDEKSVHPLIDAAVLNALNQGNKAPHITYAWLEYDIEPVIKDSP